VKLASILTLQVHIGLDAAPINPEWSLGRPPIINAPISSKNKSGTATTVGCEHTPGAFTWHYNRRETIRILDTGITLTDDWGTREVKPGDVGFIAAGPAATRHILSHVREPAFFSSSLPWIAMLGQFVMPKLRVLAKSTVTRSWLTAQRWGTCALVGIDDPSCGLEMDCFR